MSGNRHLLFIHFAVVLFGLSGLFAKFIAYPAVLIVLGRVFFAAIFLFFIMKSIKLSFSLTYKKDFILFFLLGLVLAIHWSSFFYSIQVSTVAIGLITFATFPVFSVFLEPILLKERFHRKNLMFALITSIGVLLIVQEFNFKNHLFIGVIWGLLSAVTFSILSILNRKLVRGYSSIIVGFYQNCFAFIVLVPFLLFVPFHYEGKNIFLLIILGVIFTGVSHVLFIEGLKSVNVQTASIIAVLEPVYGIIAAIFFLAEIPTVQEVFGIVIILSMAIYVTIKNK
ncbi:DMT family transporter [Anaerobacillus alkaliphilus]|uniref:DMT family transporter n=1 Tax=Anaerobacillus alkaliphilus TaxID=1548597 RepID=UPI0019D591F0|nr:DMT family transporter [Anaerobacillus alkaliphilus]